MTDKTLPGGEGVGTVGAGDCDCLLHLYYMQHFLSHLCLGKSLCSETIKTETRDELMCAKNAENEAKTQGISLFTFHCILYSDILPDSTISSNFN